MEKGCQRLLLLNLGLCFVSCYVYATQTDGVHLYDGNIFNQRQDVSKLLSELKDVQKKLENKVMYSWNTVQKNRAEKDLDEVKNAIAYMEKTSKVSYQDYLQMITRQKNQYEKEIENVKKSIEEAKNEEKNKAISEYQKKLNALITERESIGKEFEAYARANLRNEQTMKEVKQNLEEEKDEILRILEAAKNRHSLVLQAIADATYEGYRPVRISEQDAINGLKLDLKSFVSMKDKKKQNEGLLLTREKLNSLLPELRAKGRFSREAERKDIKKALAVMEMNTASVRNQQNEQRKELLQKLKEKDLTDCTDEEIASLETINGEIAVTDMFQREIANRRAYLKALLEVYGLIKECSDAIEASKKGNLAKFFEEAIQEAKNENLAKL